VRSLTGAAFVQGPESYLQGAGLTEAEIDTPESNESKEFPSTTISKEVSHV
jgi:hypothetical protein